MIKFSKQPKLGIKVALLGIGSVFVTGAALIGLAVWESGQYNLLAQKEVDSLISADLDHITQGVYNLVQTENEAVQDQVNKSLNIARDLVASHGSLGLSDEKIQWSAIDQFTNVPIKIELPKMILG
ncbi:MAG TPA: Cache 3/Cache 2 fusion domain-containing protein, partial [Candidatus Omnitrophota bacterium]|nr:Cache 3/Cache 2 fusion domain-containing protein [Candidatus Omnitrophota bacterium]